MRSDAENAEQELISFLQSIGLDAVASGVLSARTRLSLIAPAILAEVIENREDSLPEGITFDRNDWEYHEKAGWYLKDKEFEEKRKKIGAYIPMANGKA